MTAFENFREHLEAHGCAVRGSGRQLAAQCPAHEDRDPSLSVTNGNDRVLVRCHAGCDTDDVLAALGLTRNDLFDSGREQRPADPVIAVYDYQDEAGNVLFQVCRTAGKRFLQRVPDPAAEGGYRWRTDGVRRVPYRLPQLIAAAQAGKTIYVAEGEKDVRALEAAGVTATCNPGGAGKWRDDYAQFFAGAGMVVVIADRDKPGQLHARTVARSLQSVAEAEIREPAAGKDASDHLAARMPLSALTLTRSAAETATVDLAPDLHEFLSAPDPPVRWIVEGFLERGDRLILTGGEGRGKSLLLRQIAVCASAGLNPFPSGGHLEDAYVTPVRVLMIDCENSERASRRHFRRMATVAAGWKRPVGPGMLRLIHRPEGLDLNREDAPWLLERVTAHRPDLLIIGPLYRLHTGDLNDEINARLIVTALDAARLAIDCALILEAHAPHMEAGRGKRTLRPAGSSLFLRWPELGYGLRALGGGNSQYEWDRDHVAALEQWRGPREERGAIPGKVTWGSQVAVDWPWVRENAAGP